jgi:hypothetical protein
MKFYLSLLFLTLTSCGIDYKPYCIKQAPSYLEEFYINFIDARYQFHKSFGCNKQEIEELVIADMREQMVRMDDNIVEKLKEKYFIYVRK